MPSLIGDDIAKHYLVTLPTSRFGTRELAVVVLDITDIQINFEDPASLFSRAVRAIQQHVEVYTVFNPSSNRCTLLVAADTMPQDDGEEAGDGNSNSYLSDVLSNAGISATVWNAQVNGTSINYD